MADFIRSLLQVLLGFILGAFAAIYFLPEARKVGGGAAPAGPVVRQPATTGAPAAQTSGTEPEKGDSTLFGRRGGSAASGGFSEPRASTPKEPGPVSAPEPAKSDEPAVAVQPKPAEPAPAVDETPVDFRELCVKPAAWPPIITLNKEINAQVTQGEEVVAEIPLAAGEKLQVSKVFGDGTAEVRAKGAKFIVRAADTDLAAQARVRLAEISGRVRAPTPTVAPAAPVREPEPAKPAAPTPPPGKGDDLDSKMRTLFGTPQKR